MPYLKYMSNNTAPTKYIQTLGIIGFGKEGQAIFEYFKDKFQQVYIFDEKLESLPEGVKATLCKSLEIPAEVDFLVKSPGIATHKVKLHNLNLQIHSLISLLFDKLDMHKTIAVTGTKGKSTTSSLIHHILVENGKKAELLGNIGAINISLLDTFDPETYYVFELSSFQCQQLHRSPHFAVWTNFFTDHQDVHQDMTEYFEAKRQITAHQCAEDYFITIPNLEKTETQAQKLITYGLHFQTNLLGEHNQINCELAYLACQKLGLSDEQIKNSIATYHPLKGRLELVNTQKGIQFYADDLATIPEATWSAIQSFEGKNLATLIVGGYDKGLDYSSLAQKLASTTIKNFIYFNPTGEKIVANLDENQVNVLEAKNMQQALELAYNYTKSGEICLMSCASASFGLFKNAYDRGDQYRFWVEKLGSDL
jgi:UDP-N-acetylmuramoyl-L-alanine---L-glutamate ligase